MTTCLYDEWASWSTKNTQQGLILTFSVIDFNLAPVDLGLAQVELYFKTVEVEYSKV